MPDNRLTEQEVQTLEERERALAVAAEAVQTSIADYNACLAALQEVAATVAARLRAADPLHPTVNRESLIVHLEAVVGEGPLVNIRAIPFRVTSIPLVERRPDEDA